MGGSRLAGQQPIWGHCCQVLNPSTPTPSCWPGGPGPGLITPGGVLSPRWTQMTQLKRWAPAPRAHLLGSG